MYISYMYSYRKIKERGEKQRIEEMKRKRGRYYLDSFNIRCSLFKGKVSAIKGNVKIRTAQLML